MNLLFEKKIIYKTFLTVFFIGCVPLMPGTIASIASYLIGMLIFFNIPMLWIYYITCMLFTLGIITTNQYIQYCKSKDPSEIVIDEWVGLWVSYIIFSIFYSLHVLDMTVLLILFRIFDIFKRPLIQYVEKLPGGYGVMLDDIAAGIYAGVIWILMTYLLDIKHLHAQ